MPQLHLHLFPKFDENLPKITKIAPSKSAPHLKFIRKTRQFTVTSLTVSFFDQWTNCTNLKHSKVTYCVWI